MIYLDLVMVLNFLVDFLLLLGTNRLTGFPAGIPRTVMAASIGGIYAGVCLLPGFRFLGGAFWRLVALAAMAVTAFGLNWSALRRGILFLVLSMSLGGIALAMGKGDCMTLVVAAIGLFVICRLVVGNITVQRKFSHVILRKGSKTMHLTALCDTGNTLKDPITGQTVLVAGADVANFLLGLTVKDLSAPIDAISVYPGLRLIPYRAVGSSRGMLLAAQMDEVIIGGEHGGKIVAFAPQEFRNEGFQALTGGI